MSLTEKSILKVGDEFSRAAMGEGSWELALNTMSDVLGMRSGQLVAFGKDSLIPLNVMTRKTAEASSEFVEIDGGNPAVNSKVRIGFARPELTVLDEADYDTAGDRIRNPEFASWMDRHDIGYCCVSTLVRTPDTLVGLASLQSADGAALNDEGKRAFGTIATAARNAVLLREAIEDQGLKLVVPALEAARNAALIVDVSGKVKAMTPSAELIVSAQRFGRILGERFVPHNANERVHFEARLRFALQAWSIPQITDGRPCILSSRDGERIVVEFLPMPPEHSFNFSAAALVIFKRRGNNSAKRASVAASLFGLTHAETRVTQCMLDGMTPAEIAVRTGASVGTVRNHVHRILSKAGCHSQTSFVALLVSHY